MDSGSRVNIDPARAMPDTPEDYSRVRQFVRSPWSVRCNVVKVWRPLPAGLWTSLAEADDAMRARRAERVAVVSVLAMAAALVIGFSGMGVCAALGELYQCFPVVGTPSLSPTSDTTPLGLYFKLGLSFPAVFWAVGPSIAGWTLVRLFWIPSVVRNKPSRGAAITMTRYLGSVYLYVYLMICGGAVLLLVVARVAPAETTFIRWCFWCFLFGESFFVPGVMWIRLVLAEGSVEVFGRFRYALLAGYLVLFVVVPIYGMTFELG
jgi:hypothetical protein